MSAAVPEIVRFFRFFDHAHLAEPQRGIASQCASLAAAMVASLPACAETSAGLRKLLEAKDCFVRASLPPLT